MSGPDPFAPYTEAELAAVDLYAVVGETMVREQYAGTVRAAAVDAALGETFWCRTISGDLHPRRFRAWLLAEAARVRTLNAFRPGAHLAVHMNHPVAVDLFPPERVAVLYGGNVALLSDGPRVAKHRAYMRSGEMWSALGEEWVVEACRAREDR